MAEVVGLKVQVDGSEAVKSIGSIKTQLKEANAELIAAQKNFGDYSQEAVAAAKKVAGLKDSIQEARETADLFDPGKKFQAFTGVLTSVAGGFSAVQGALGLVGAESGNVEKALLKVQSAMALSQGLSTIKDSAKDFQRLGAVIVSSLGKGGAIGLAITGVTALALVLADVFTKKQNQAAQAYADTLENYKTAASGAIEETTKVKVAFEQARTGVISKKEALQLYNDTLGDSLGKTNDLSVAEKNLADKADAYIKITALKAQANALFAKSAEKSADALIIQQEIDQLGLKESGGFLGAISETASSKVKEAEAAAVSINELGAKLLTQATELSKQFDIADTKRKESISTKVKNDGAEQKRLLEERLQAEKEAAQKILDLQNEVFLQSIKDEAQRALVKLSQDKEKQINEINATKATAKQKAEQIALIEEQFRLQKIEIENNAAEERKLKEEQELTDLVDRLSAENNIQREYLERDKKIKEEYAAADLEATKDLQEKKYQAIDTGLNLIGSLAGKNEALGNIIYTIQKAIEIGKIISSTTSAISQVNAQTAAIPTVLPPGVPNPAFPIAVASAAKKILGLKLGAASGIASLVASSISKFKGGGGASNIGGTQQTSNIGSAAAPIAPQAQQAQLTQLDQGTINRLGSATNRAYVVESDITSNQERIRRINRAARLN